MFRSLKLGRLFGIPLYIHWTFWILPLWIILAHGALVELIIWMLLFSMIPAFPLDGGRVFRASLCFFLDRLRATRAAVYGGMALTVLLLAVVLVRRPEYVSPFLIVIVFFLFSAG